MTFPICDDSQSTAGTLAAMRIVQLTVHYRRDKLHRSSPGTTCIADHTIRRLETLPTLARKASIFGSKTSERDPRSVSVEIGSRRH